MTFAVAWLWAGAADAQVNVETLRRKPFEAGYGLEVAGSLSLTSGNVDSLDVGAAARLQFIALHPAATPTTADPARPDPVPYLRERTFLAASTRYAEKSGSAFANQVFVHARHTRMFLPRLGWEAFAQFQTNEFWRLRDREVAGAAVRVQVWHRRALSVAVATALMAEYERIAVAKGASDPPTSQAVRSSSYLTARLAFLDDQLLLQNTTYFQPKLGDAGDWRLLNETELLVAVGSNVAFGSLLNLLRDNRPPTGVRALDLRLTSTVKVLF
ncbi:MAG: DUF481 domain-containing protein [Deltaproteobacteria bacterium]|nr:DUF481 domain-containing protein [Deltaproteobacteria bacterium]